MLRFHTRDIKAMSAQQIHDLLDDGILISTEVRKSLIRRLRIIDETKDESKLSTAEIEKKVLHHGTGPEQKTRLKNILNMRKQKHDIHRNTGTNKSKTEQSQGITGKAANSQKREG